MSSTTTRNRLQELRSSAGIKQGDAATDPAANLPWNRPGGGHDTKQNAAQRTSRIRIVLADIDRDITDYFNVLVLASEMRRAIGQSEEARILDEMEQALEQSKLYNAKVKGCLDDLEGVQSKKGNALTKAEKDYCKSIIRDKSARFQEEIKALLSAQAAFENEQKLKVRKQMTVLYPEATAEELRVIEEDPDAMKKLMQEKIKRGSKQSQASGNAEEEASLREQIEQLQSQQDAMVRLEESVVELSELFFYLNTLMD
eukprot:g15331.t1